MFRIGFRLALLAIIASGTLRAEGLPPIRLASDIRHPRDFCVAETLRYESIQTENWSWQMYPDGFIYPTYLAAVQNRLGGVWNYDPKHDWMWDITLGGRLPLYRYGTKSSLFPEGWQLDMEGSVYLRLHLMEGMDMEANDFRFGLPLSYGTKIWQFRTGYCHVSSHLGDERLLRGDQYHPKGGIRNPERLNYWRESLLLSYAYRPTPNTRAYAEVDYACKIGKQFGEGTKPWHFQFGAEYSPRYPTARGVWGTPFAAVNTRLMQEHNFRGNVTVQTGWQWRGSHDQLFRIGMQYHSGVGDQYEFIFTHREHKIGIGVWVDF
jgi:hypothetical protein